MPPHTLAIVKNPPRAIAARIGAVPPQSPTIRQAQSAAAHLIRQLLALIRSAVERRIQASRILQDEHHLSMLPDHLLRDIGISRTDIGLITRQGRSRPNRRSS